MPLRPLGHYLQVLRGQQRPIRFLASRLLMRTGLCRRLQVRTRGYALRFHCSALAADKWIDPLLEREEERFAHDYLRPSDIVVDVGANIGTFTLTASGIAGAGRVTAIEAHPRIFGYLRENIALNGRGNVVAMNNAVSDAEGVVEFSDSWSDVLNRIAASGGRVKVRAARLDTLLDDRSVDLLKIDIEGYELQALRGAPGTLARTRCVYFESYLEHQKAYGYTTTQLLDLVRGHGFAVFAVDHEARRIRALPAAHESRVCENLVALRDADEFRDRTRYAVTS